MHLWIPTLSQGRVITAGNKSVTANVNDIIHNGYLQSNENQTTQYPQCPDR